MSDYLEEELLTHIFRTSSFTKPTVLSIALLTTGAAETDDGQFTTGTGVEVPNSNSYARQTLNPLDANWSDPSAGTQGETDNLSEIAFPQASGSWGTIVAIAICDSATYDAGNMLLYGTLTASKAVGSGDTFKFAIGDLNIAFD